MRQLDNEAEYQRILRNAEGFIFDDHSGGKSQGSEFNVLHRSICWTLRNTHVNKKYYDDNLQAATAWLAVERGAEGQWWHRCLECQ